MHKLVDQSSGPGAHSGFRVFGVPPSNVSVIKSQVREILPLNTISSDSQWDFRHFSDDQWLDLSNVYLYFQLILEKKTAGVWTPIVEADKSVASIQTIGQSLIKTLKMFINGNEVYSETLYPYMCYMKNALNFSEDVRSIKLESAGYRPIDKIDDATDKGFQSHVRMFEKGRTAEFMSKLEFDLANQDRFLLNKMDVIFSLYKGDDEFLVHALGANDNNDYRFRVENIKLFVKTIEAQPEVDNAITSILHSGTIAKYPLRRIEMRSVYATIGRTELIHNVFTNVVPRSIVVGFVNNKAYSGDRTKNPFNFVNADVRTISIIANGLEYPNVRYDLKFNNNVFIRAFVDMHDAVGLLRKNITNGITRLKFRNGWCLFVIPLTTTLENTGGFDPVKTGTTTIKVTFNSAVPDPGYCMIVMGEFDGCMYFDEGREVASDGAV